MKHFFFFVLIIVAIISTSCEPSIRTRQQVIREYFNNYSAYQFDIKYKLNVADTMYQTSSTIIFSQDAFDAQRQFEPVLSSFTEDYFNVSMTYKEIQVDYEYPQ